MRQQGDRGGTVLRRAIIAALFVGGANGVLASAGDDAPPWSVILGAEHRDDEFEGFGDIIVPLFTHDTGLLFLNPRASGTDSSEEEGNLGLGYRGLVNDGRWILGLNTYLDYRTTERDADFGQWGLGVEALGRWVDVRANYYRPFDRREQVGEATLSETQQWSSVEEGWGDPYATEHSILQDYLVRRAITTTTTTHYYEQYEYAREGVDGEIGLRLPMPERAQIIEPRVFFGGYYFNGEYGQPDVEGWKGRLEVRVGRHVYLDFQLYEDDELTGSDYAAGLRVAFPFDPVELAHGRNPFRARAGADEGLRRRLTDMVMRDPHIRTALTDYREDVGRLESQTRLRIRNEGFTATLADDVMFVDGDRGSAGGDGTAERPLGGIQDAANRAFGAKNVYVFTASQPYRENLQVPDGVRLWGGMIYGADGRYFGHLPKPVIQAVGGGQPVQFTRNGVVSGFLLDYADGTPLYDTMNLVSENGVLSHPDVIRLPGGGVSHGCMLMVVNCSDTSYGSTLSPGTAIGSFSFLDSSDGGWVFVPLGGEMSGMSTDLSLGDVFAITPVSTQLTWTSGLALSSFSLPSSPVWISPLTPASVSFSYSYRGLSHDTSPLYLTVGPAGWTP